MVRIRTVEIDPFEIKKPASKKEPNIAQTHLVGGSQDAAEPLLTAAVSPIDALQVNTWFLREC